MIPYVQASQCAVPCAVQPTFVVLLVALGSRASKSLALSHSPLNCHSLSCSVGSRGVGSETPYNPRQPYMGPYVGCPKLNTFKQSILKRPNDSVTQNDFRANINVNIKSMVLASDAALCRVNINVNARNYIPSDQCETMAWVKEHLKNVEKTECIDEKADRELRKRKRVAAGCGTRGCVGPFTLSRVNSTLHRVVGSYVAWSYGTTKRHS